MKINANLLSQGPLSRTKNMVKNTQGTPVKKQPSIARPDTVMTQSDKKGAYFDKKV